MASSRRRFRWVFAGLIPLSVILSVLMASWMLSQSLVPNKAVSKALQDVFEMEVARASVPTFGKLDLMSPQEIAGLQGKLATLKPEMDRRKRIAQHAFSEFWAAQVRAVYKSFIPFSLPLGYGVFMSIRLWLLYRIPSGVLPRRVG